MARCLRARRYRLALAATGIVVFTYIESLPTYNYRLPILPPVPARLLARLCASMPNSRGSRDVRWICIKCSFVEQGLAKRTEQSDDLSACCSLVKIDTRDRAIFREERELWGEWEKVEPSKKAQPKTRAIPAGLNLVGHSM